MARMQVKGRCIELINSCGGVNFHGTCDAGGHVSHVRRSYVAVAQL